MRGATAQLGALAVFASAALFLAGTGTMRRIELTGEGQQFSQHGATGYVHLTDNNGFGTNAAFIDKGNLPEGMVDDTRGDVLMDKHVQNVAPEGGYIDVKAKQGSTWTRASKKPAAAPAGMGTDKVFQQKADVAEPAPSADAKASGYVHLSDNNGFGTNFAFIGKRDGEGTSVADEAHFEQLSLKGRKGVQKQPVKGKKQPVKAKGFGYNAKLHHKAHLIKKPKVAFEKKGKTEMLSQQYLEFGQKARDFYVKHGLMSKAADAWAKKMGTGWEKAPVQMLAQVKSAACGNGGPCPAGPAFIRKSGLTSAAEVAWSKHFDVEDAADKAPTTMLAQRKVQGAAQAVGKDVTSYLFAQSSQAGL